MTAAAPARREPTRPEWLANAARTKFGVCAVCGEGRDTDGKPLQVARAERARTFRCFDCTTHPPRRRKPAVSTTATPVLVSIDDVPVAIVDPAPTKPARAKAAKPEPPAAPAQRFEMVPLAKLKPAPDNPRKDVGDVTEMAATMRTLGVIEPFVTVQQNGHYLIVAGHRRYAAAQLAELVEVPTIIRELTEEQRVEAMLIENLQREDLTPIDEASAYKRLVDEFKIPQRDLAVKVGRSQGHISKRMQLLQLPAKVLKDVDSGGITIADALELVKLIDHPKLIDEAVKNSKAWGQPISRLVGDAIRDLDKVIAFDREVQAIKDAGLKYVKIGEYGDMPRGSIRVDPDRAYDSLPMKVGAHAKLPCHAAGVLRGQRVYVCTDPSQHPELDKAKQKVATDQKAVRARQHEKDLTAARAERRAFLTELSNRSITKDELLGIVVDGFLSRAEAEARKVAGQILGLEPIRTKSKYTSKMETSWYGVLEAYAEKSLPNKLRVGAVLAWASREIHLNSEWITWGTDAKAYFASLEALGYTPTPAEKLELTGKSPRR